MCTCYQAYWYLLLCTWYQAFRVRELAKNSVCTCMVQACCFDNARPGACATEPPYGCIRHQLPHPTHFCHFLTLTILCDLSPFSLLCYSSNFFVSCDLHDTHTHAGPLLDWLVHVMGLCTYTALDTISGPLRNSPELRGLVVALMTAGSRSHVGSVLRGEGRPMDALLSSSSRGTQGGVGMGVGAPAGALAVSEGRVSQQASGSTLQQLYVLNRLLEALEYGSGRDYKL
jgi:hypothetical protein